MHKSGLIILCLLLSVTTAAQQILDKMISVDINNLPLEQALRLVSNKGNFYFSYNSNIIPATKRVSAPQGSTTIKQVLDYILSSRYEYIETNNYLILKLLPAKITIVSNTAAALKKDYIITGYVLDASNEYRLSDATVYEKKQLASSLTNQQGYFKIRLRQRYRNAALTVSKFMYNDTTIAVSPSVSRQLSIVLTPSDSRGEIMIIKPGDYYNIPFVAVDPLPAPLPLFADTFSVERTARAGFLISASQKLRSLNLRNFFTSRPYQVSLTPGLSTQGKLGAQVTNHASLNMLGGYTGGVEGAEIAGLFNINKREVKYVQVAGLFNISGGNMEGVQVAGLNNTLLSKATGVQLAGISNIVRENLTGIQVAGIYNHVSDTVKGLQFAGISNFAKEKVNGIQVSGIGNLANKHMDGVQVAGIFNYAKKLRGVQIGLINIADTSEGYSIGLLNIILKGYHKLVISSNETMNINVAFKTGNHKLYSILMVGYNRSAEAKAYALGYGIGREFSFGRHLSLNPELSSQYLYLGSVFDVNLLHKLQLDLHIRPFKHFSVFGGTSFNVHYSDQSIAIPGYNYHLRAQGQHTYKVSANSIGWVGWSVGVALF